MVTMPDIIIEVGVFVVSHCVCLRITQNARKGANLVARFVIRRHHRVVPKPPAAATTTANAVTCVRRVVGHMYGQGWSVTLT